MTDDTSKRSLAAANAEIDRLHANYERLSQEMQALGGFGTLINVLENSIGGVVNELAPLKDLAPPQTTQRLDRRTARRLRNLEDSLDRVRADSYTLPVVEFDVGFLHDTPVFSENENENEHYEETGTGAAS